MSLEQEIFIHRCIHKCTELLISAEEIDQLFSSWVRLAKLLQLMEKKQFTKEQMIEIIRESAYILEPVVDRLQNEYHKIKLDKTKEITDFLEKCEIEGFNEGIR